MTPQPPSTRQSTPTPKPTSDPGFGQAELVRAIAGALPNDWEVEVEPTVGLYPSDLLISPTYGALLVVDVNVDPGIVHFAELGEAAASRSGVSAAGDAHAVLITTGEAPHEIERLAKDLDVELIPTSGDDLAEVTRASVDGLMALASRFRDQSGRCTRGAKADVEDLVAKKVLEMLRVGKQPAEIAEALDLDDTAIRSAYQRLLQELQTKNPDAVDDVMRQWQSAPP